MTESINLLAVGVSAIASFGPGFLWFAVVFRQPYLEGLGNTAEELARGPSSLQATLAQLGGNLLMAYVLAWLILHTGQQTVIGGMRVGTIAWLGFIAAVIGPMYVFQAFSLQFFAITAGYPLVALLIMGAILGRWRWRSGSPLADVALQRTSTGVKRGAPPLNALSCRPMECFGAATVVMTRAEGGLLRSSFLPRTGQSWRLRLGVGAIALGLMRSWRSA